MKPIQSLIRSSFFRRQFQIPNNNRTFSALPLSDYGHDQNDDYGKPTSFTSIYQKTEKSGNRFSFTTGVGSSFLDGLKENDIESTLIDGIDYKLRKAADTFFEFDPDEVMNDDYTFRPDVNFQARMTYDTEDLDLQKPGVRKPPKRHEFETTTKEVLSKADFRNVRFLAQFLTEAGIIIKRSKTGISAKAQRKVAREIKTARAFGLMPFTTMGTKHFVYGKSMEDHEMDFGYEANEYNFVDEEKE